MRYSELKGLNLVWEIDKIALKSYQECYPGEPLTPEDTFLIHYYRGQVAEANYWIPSDVLRDDPALLQVVEELEEEASRKPSKLRIVEIPDGVDWKIEEHDGLEHVAEKHQTWW